MVESMTNAQWRADPSSNAFDEIRSNLVDAAICCIEENGPDRLRVEEVVAVAGVSRATFYRYFTDKEELLVEVMARNSVRLAEELADVLGSDPPAGTPLGDVVIDGIMAAIRMVRNDPFSARFFDPRSAGLTSRLAAATTMISGLIADSMTDQTVSGAFSGRFRSDLPTRQIAEWITLVIVAVLTSELDEQKSDDELEAMFEAFLLPAILAS
ncbi:MAG: hypothetical protein JJLCMIEE_01658 [Acidimicrobiales bacterium]|nr:MAG: TetR/AcrR family transcriptional regulator [Actinomycetota bacterium]MBV6508593.1 hypothetical protein [Acidimicrobiales bacterium]RIK05104.1 MAG: hypothetical protein DCC48_10770 [Acidobacteriota bacterium]